MYYTILDYLQMIFVKYISGYYLANILVSQIKFMHQGNLRPKAQGFSTIVPNWFTKRNRSHAHRYL